MKDVFVNLCVKHNDECLCESVTWKLVKVKGEPILMVHLLCDRHCANYLTWGSLS